MCVFIGKGGKNRRRGKNENESDKRELIFKEDGQGRCDVIYMCVCLYWYCVCILEYAQVLKMLGNGRLEAYCFDGMNRLCHIRGKLRKKVIFLIIFVDIIIIIDRYGLIKEILYLLV